MPTRRCRWSNRLCCKPSSSGPTQVSVSSRMNVQYLIVITCWKTKRDNFACPARTPDIFTLTRRLCSADVSLGWGPSLQLPALSKVVCGRRLQSVFILNVSTIILVKSKIKSKSSKTSRLKSFNPNEKNKGFLWFLWQLLALHRIWSSVVGFPLYQC